MWTSLAIPGGGKAMSGTSFSSPLVAVYSAAAIKYKKITHRNSLRAYFKKIAKARGKKRVGIPTLAGALSELAPLAKRLLNLEISLL